MICRIIDADDGHDGRVGSVMKYSGAEGGSGEVPEEGDEDIGGVLVGDDSDDFVGAQLLKDLAGGLSAWDNGCSGSSAKIVDDGVDSRVIGIAGDDIERVSGKAHPGGSAFPVAEVTGDENGAFAFGEGLVEIFATDDGGGCFEVGL